MGCWDQKQHERSLPHSKVRALIRTCCCVGVDILPVPGYRVLTSICAQQLSSALLYEGSNNVTTHSKNNLAQPYLATQIPSLPVPSHIAAQNWPYLANMSLSHQLDHIPPSQILEFPFCPPHQYVTTLSLLMSRL